MVFTDQNANEKLIDYTAEILKCKRNPLYFIFNYVKVSEIGGKFRYSKERMHPKMKRTIRIVMKYHKCLLMASRQLGKSTIAACLLAWAAVFYPKNRISIFNFDKKTAKENLEKVKDIIMSLPDWMRQATKANPTTRGDLKSELTLSNGTKINTFYPTTTIKPETLARSLTVPIVYVDEVAFISHMSKIWGSAQQTMAKAREQAIKNNYPYFVLFTTTPNGISGDGKFFYDMWLNAVDSDLLFEKDQNSDREIWVENDHDIVNDPSRNGYIKVKFHWSEDPNKDEKWYEEQKRDLNFDKRKINQELDLKFVATSYCIFDDDILEQMVPSKTVHKMPLKHGAYIKFFEDINKLNRKDYYLVGVDTASSITGAFNAIEIFRYSDFRQIGELAFRIGHLAKYGEIVDQVFKMLAKAVDYRVILCIENNSIGKAIIEHLTYHIKDFNYYPFIYHEKEKEELGIRTDPQTKELMISLFYELIREDPSCIKSDDLINQLSSIERSARGTIAKKSFTDMFMAGCFCAYVRKMKFLEIFPLIEKSDSEVQDSLLTEIRLVSSLMNPKLATNRRHITKNKTVEEPTSPKNDNNMSNNPFFDLIGIIGSVDSDMDINNNNDDDDDSFGFVPLL